jgi:hypothetical protein
MRTTKAQIKKQLQGQIDTWYKERTEAIQGMLELQSNPQVALMIARNQAYRMALEDVTELLYSRKIF